VREMKRLWRSTGLVRWLPMFFFYLLQVGLTATSRVGFSGRVLTRAESIEGSVVSWTIWALLGPLILGIDRRLPIARDALIKRFLLHVPLGLFFTALNLALNFFVVALLAGRHHDFLPTLDVFRGWLDGAFQIRFIVYWVVVFVYSAYDYANHLREKEVRAAESERLASEARLAALTARLHPHFLFNALNTISTHVEQTPRTARRMLEQLGELLRLTLAHAEDQEIPLSQEIAFIERYLYLQKARFEERLAATVKVEPDALHALVPTFILQPLVENAVRYGTEFRPQQSVVEVSAWRSDEQLHLRVRDNGPGLPAGWDPEVSVGNGISTTRARLECFYGVNEQSFTISSQPMQGVCVDMTVPFRVVQTGKDSEPHHRFASVHSRC